jgi:hypothetical protein
MKEGIRMMERTRHVPALMLLLGLSAFLFGGCGGGGTGPNTPTSSDTNPTTPTTAPPLVVTTTQGAGLVDGLPGAYVAALGERPVVVLFYAPGGVADEKVLTAVRELLTSYSGYTFLMYDYSVADAYGDLAKLLQIKALPQIVLIDRRGTIPDPDSADDRLRVWSGYVDKGTLNQALVNLGRE